MNEGNSGETGDSRAVARWNRVAAVGFALGVAGLLALVTVAFLAPVEAEAGLTGGGTLGLGLVANEIELRSAGVLIFLVVAGALFLSSARQSNALAVGECRSGLEAGE